LPAPFSDATLQDEAGLLGGACRCKRSNKRQRGGSRDVLPMDASYEFWSNSSPAQLGGACRCKRSNKRQRGGLSAFSPAPFSGANPPYQQYMSNIPASNNFSVGAESLSPAMSGMANPVPITAFPNCPTK
jgi:hypothetical protein